MGKERWQKKEIKTKSIVPFSPAQGTSQKEHSRIHGKAVSLAREISNRTSEIKSRLAKRTRTENNKVEQDLSSGLDSNQVQEELFPGDAFTSETVDTSISSQLPRGIVVKVVAAAREMPVPEYEFDPEVVAAQAEEELPLELWKSKLASKGSDESDQDSNYAQTAEDQRG